MDIGSFDAFTIALIVSWLRNSTDSAQIQVRLAEKVHRLGLDCRETGEFWAELGQYRVNQVKFGRRL
eukprot:2942862-Rhodomonas_salina.1